MENRKLIEVKNVTKRFKVYTDKAFTLKEKVIHRKRRRYQEREVLKDVSLTIERGEIVGLIGENGSGKSTLLKLMTGILYPEEGTLSIQGRVSSLLELGAGFHPDLSGRENVYTNAAIFGLTKKETDARFQSILDFSELHEFIDNPVRTYSSGMYMRLAFSVAINVDAEILLIDEILTVGDANFKKKCYARLDQLKKDGITIVLVSHEISVIEKFCTRAIWINHGRVARDGERYQVTNAYKSYMRDKQMQLFGNGKDYDRDDVLFAYTYFLKRAPENEKIINIWCNNYHDMHDVVFTIIDTEEFVFKYKSSGGDPENIDKEELLREFEAYRFDMRRKMEEDVVPEEEDEDELPSDEVIDNGEKRMRFGSGEVAIHGVAFSTPTEKNVDTLVSGQDAVVSIFYKVNEPQQRYVFGFDIFTVDNVHCYGTNMRMDEYMLHELKESGHIDCTLKGMNLAAGEYKINVYVLNARQAALDYIRNYRDFYVTSENNTGGIIEMPHEWSE